MDFLTLVYKVSPIVRFASFGLLVGSHLSWQYWLVVKVTLFSAHMIRFGGQPNRQFIAVLPLLCTQFCWCPCSLDIEIDYDLVGQLPTLPPAPPATQC